MSARAWLVAVFGGNAPRDVWEAVLREERPVSGKPRACPDCPLRKGGECDNAGPRSVGPNALRRFGCHAHEGRPCSGAERIAREVEATPATPETTAQGD